MTNTPRQDPIYSSRPLPIKDGDPDIIEPPLSIEDVLVRLQSGVVQMIGLALLGGAIAFVGMLALGQLGTAATSTRVVLSFPGIERGEYPDGSKFQQDDIRSPAIISLAMQRRNIQALYDLQSRIRGAITVEGIIDPNVTKERDRLRATGQTLAPIVPDEYRITLALPRSNSLPLDERNRLLADIVSVYSEVFQQTYAAAPPSFGNAFATLRKADFPEYQLILDKEMEGIASYLRQKLEKSKQFRSTKTNLTFKDLLDQTQLFSEMRLNETLGIIHENGLSRNRRSAMTKMDYQLKIIGDQERRAVEEDMVVKGLLEQSQSRAQNYVLAIKSQATKATTDTPVVEQSLIDALLANDAYNFLLRRALESGVRVKQIQADRAKLLEVRENMNSFLNKEAGDQTALIAQVEDALSNLQIDYNNLITKIRDTNADFAHQQYGNAIRITDEMRTSGIAKPLITATAVGAVLGVAVAVGLSLLGVFISGKKRSHFFSALASEHKAQQ